MPDEGWSYQVGDENRPPRKPAKDELTSLYCPSEAIGACSWAAVRRRA
jgi:hypothetical protein